MLPPRRPGAPQGLETEADDEPQEVERRAAQVGIAQHGLRLDKLLVDIAGEFSRSHLQRLIDDGCVQVDGRVVTVASRKVQAGQQVVVELRPTAESQAFRPEPVPLDIRHEDEHLIVLHKPAGLVVHPAAGNWSGTLLNGLLAHHPGAAALPRAGIVHRLDKDTSGLMVVGKTLEAVTALVRAIAAREVRREYLALVHGEIRDPAALASIDAPIGRDPQSRVRIAVVAGGKPARTDVTVQAVRDGVTAVACRLHTGRTHQIRVHLAHRGHPLVGDALYGGRPLLGLTRQALHAWRLGLAHPVGGAALSFEAAPPDDFARAWDAVAGARV
ncbi:RluA family pseudouridine synthase [Caldimonas thermodepolymerans]|uniref:Pseudouridine synthase n=1 Tax=Caldimonas thermodepolymerans TaxID=215580 RepID=A0AA46HVP9_9BURK|nr:RluA family pseudouridine synthase [Caldimonas thermodepolymerans]TCP07203.1 ribosomal large subunit pseudouridine synthase D [Caldimonas thermodepolymerans]UZG46557.1 RluA family pseudouridine synthase [Caldimonas thermodepolymerans]